MAGPADMDAEILTDLNQLLKTATPWAAYAMGAASALAWKAGLQPDRLLFEFAGVCQSFEDIDRVFEDWKRYRRL